MHGYQPYYGYIGEYLGLYNFVNLATGKYSQFTFNLAIYACNIEEEYFDNYLQQLFIDLKYFSSLYISTFKTQKNEEEEEEEEEQEN